MPSSEDFFVDPETKARILKTASALGGHTDRYQWGQTDTEIFLQTLVPDGIKSRDVDLKLTTTTMMMSVCGSVLIDGATFAPIVPDDSTYVLEDEPEEGGRRITVTLRKKTPTAGKLHWSCVVQGEPEIDVSRFAKEVKFLPKGCDPLQLAHMHNPAAGQQMFLIPSDEDADADPQVSGKPDISGLNEEEIKRLLQKQMAAAKERQEQAREASMM